DGDDFALLRFGEQVVVLQAPVGRHVDAEGLAAVIGIARRALHGVDDAHLEHVARLGAIDIDRAGAYVYTHAAAGTGRVIHRACTATVDGLAVLVPLEDAFDTGIALDHSFVIVEGVVRHGFHRGVVPRVQLHQWIHGLAEVAAVNGVLVGRDVVVLDVLAFLLGRQRTLRDAAVTCLAADFGTADTGT